MKYLVAILIFAVSVICVASAEVVRYWHNESYTPIIIEFDASWKCAANIHNQVICWRDM